MSSPSSKKTITPKTKIRLARQPALELAKTLVVGKTGTVDLIPDFASLCQWLVRHNLIKASRKVWLSKRWSKTQQRSFVAVVKNYRRLIKRVMENKRKGRKVPRQFVRETNRMLRAADAFLGIQSTTTDKYVVSWSVDWAKPRSVLGIIAEQGMRIVCNFKPTRARKSDDPDVEIQRHIYLHHPIKGSRTW